MKLYIKADGEEREVLLPDTQIVMVQAFSNAGQPLSNVIITAPVGPNLVWTSFVMPDQLVGLLRVIMQASAWSHQHNGDMSGFFFAAYTQQGQPEQPLLVPPPTPSPVPVPAPVPVPPSPAPVVDAGLPAAEARITAYARTRRIGAPHAGAFQIGPGWYGRNYEGGADATGLCIVVDSAHGTWLVRNGFFENYTEKTNPPRSKLGPPVEDEHGTGPGVAEQRFANGKLKWNVVRGVWAEMS